MRKGITNQILVWVFLIFLFVIMVLLIITLSRGLPNMIKDLVKVGTSII